MRHEINFYMTKFLKPKYDFHGVYLIPDIYPDKGEVWWNVKNPNNLSYSIESLRNHVWDIFEGFCKLSDAIGSGMKDSLFSTYHKAVGNFYKPNNRYFINQEDFQTLTDRMHMMKEINFKNFHADIKCDWFEITPGEDFTVEVGMRFMKCTDKETGHIYTDKELGSDGGVLSDVFEDESFYNDYEYTLFNPMVSFIVNNPLLFDNSFMYFTNSITPLNKEGRPLKVWSH